MIISPSRNYIFVHIPKTGGTAVSLALEARAKADDILIGDTPKAKKRKRRLQGVETRGRLWKHSTLADIEGLLTRSKFADMLIFTLVRNPWDRMVSYYHWLQVQEFDHPAVVKAKSLPFAEFVLDSFIATSIKASPARSYLTDSIGMTYNAVYVRLERFKEDILPVEQHLGFALKLQKTNSSRRDPDYRRYYTYETAAQVAQMASEDIHRFGYVF
ncbi:MAG: sulfotransferase family protein [Marinovum sp.]|nr:sulfotransferase family protein [Marinovum sp.]